MCVAGGCVADNISVNADLVMGTMSVTSPQAGPIEIDGQTLVYAADLPGLVASVGSVELEEDKKDLVKRYLILQERITCILDDAKEATETDTTIRCKGKILVEKQGEYGLLGVSAMLEEISVREGEMTQRDYLEGYLENWANIQQINRVEESLSQMTRTHRIPVFGALVNAIHKFPIMYEGDILVTKEEIPVLLDSFKTLDTDEAKREMVIEYLGR